MKVRCRIYKNGKKVFDKTQDVIIHENGEMFIFDMKKYPDYISLGNGDRITIEDV